MCRRTTFQRQRFSTAVTSKEKGVERVRGEERGEGRVKGEVVKGELDGGVGREGRDGGGGHSQSCVCQNFTNSLSLYV